VSPIWHSAKLILKIKKSLPSARSRALGKARLHSAGISFFLSHSLTLSQSRRRRRRLPPRPRDTAATPRHRRARSAHALAARPQPRPRHTPCPRRAPAASPLCLPSLCPRRAPAVAPPCVPSSCPRRALAVPPPPRPATRRLVRDPSSRPLGMIRFNIVLIRLIFSFLVLNLCTCMIRLILSIDDCRPSCR
jgi:hypothetical protein